MLIKTAGVIIAFMLICSLQGMELVKSIKLPVPGWAFAVKTSGNYAFVAGGEAGLLAYNITNPDNPILVTSFATRGYAQNLTLIGNLAFIADANRGLCIIDISHPDSLKAVSYFETGGYTSDISVSGNYAFLADAKGLIILNISDPDYPTLVDSLGVRDSIYYQNMIRIETCYPLAVSMQSGRHVKIMDISDPFSVRIIDSPINSAGDTMMDNSLLYLARGDERSMEFYQSYVLIAAGFQGLQALDIRDPRAPAPASSIALPGEATDVAVSGNYAFVASQYEGLKVVRLDLPVANELLSLTPPLQINNTPNPFNAGTTIAYSLPYASGVSLDIYDVSGKRVENLLSRELTAGRHETAWNSAGLASGFYFCRLRAGNTVQTLKLTLKK